MVDVETLKRIKEDFFEQHDWDDFNIGLYHGTDRFILDLSEEKRKLYHDALVRQLNILCEMDIKGLNDNEMDETEKKAFFIKKRRENLSTNFEYGALYTTSDLERAKFYATQASYFGELGSVVYGLRSLAKKQQLVSDSLSETDEILEELFCLIKKRDPNPVILKIMGKDRILEMENGDLFYDKYRKMGIREYCSYPYPRLPQLSFRMVEELTLNDFEIIDTEKECESIKGNKQRIVNMFDTYITTRLVNEFGLDENQIAKLRVLGMTKPSYYK